VHPLLNNVWETLAAGETGINRDTDRHRLSLLPSGPDEVHDRLLRGGRFNDRSFPYKTLEREFSPA